MNNPPTVGTLTPACGSSPEATVVAPLGLGVAPDARGVLVDPDPPGVDELVMVVPLPDGVGVELEPGVVVPVNGFVGLGVGVLVGLLTDPGGGVDVLVTVVVPPPPPPVAELEPEEA